ncbi:SDR family oxidoreductase [Lysobacter sp. A3-1-A15]|uniref:SDR family oxidoreductase n=1 Tax=Novilysobacter viscosus TaxID=3098602 RepID=UPI002EDA8D4B
MTLTPPIHPPPARPLDGRTIVITGGAQGIGRGIAQAVLGAGGRVCIGDTDADAGRAALEEWNVGDCALFLRVDVAREAQVARFVQRARSHFGPVHGLVNNAGGTDPVNGPLEKLDLREWQRRLGASLGGAFLCSKHLLPALREAAGDGGAASIVNIASTRAHQSEPDCEAYAAAKGGLVAFTHALAVSAGPGVRVNCISPGWIATDAWRKPTARRRPGLSRRDQAQHPAGRVGTPDDIGALAVHLLSAAAGFTTGQEFIVDGGMTRLMRYD